MEYSFQASAFESPAREQIISTLTDKLNQSNKHTRAEFVLELVSMIDHELTVKDLMDYIDDASLQTL